jgi:UV DNA damage endonuclease
LDSNDLREITRTWERQRFSVLERSPALYQDIRSAIEEGSHPALILNLIDAALDEAPTGETIVSAANSAFDLIRTLLSKEERDAFLELLNRVNGHAATPVELKLNLLGLAVRHHATALLEATYFDDVRVFAAR